jgi:GH43 family beta-xylosidase
MNLTRSRRSTSYLNPVYQKNFPDPYVLKYCGEYWAYATGLCDDGRAFGILHSPDLVQWRAVGSAMDPLPEGYPCYWAPEVIYDNGRFFMYYSVGSEELMQIRVATASTPQGPFVDSGQRLTTEPFAIDPHLFEDEDGRRYLFYATDFYDHSHVGTGTVMAPLLNPFRLGQPGRPVTRPRFDWQVYDPQREAKGGVRWHTVEGPFVLRRKGVYYQMFSGGNWRNPGYGVGYGRTRSLQNDQEWEQVCDGEKVLPILRTVPGVVMGPGHNSVVRGPNNMELYCVYHRWGDGDGRQMAIDPLAWAGERLLVLGPSHQPRQIAGPAFADFLGSEERQELGPAWQCSGARWQVQEGAAVVVDQPDSDGAWACYDAGVSAFIAEVSARAGRAGAVGLVLCQTPESPTLHLRLLAAERQALVRYHSGAGWQEERLPLAPLFDFSAYHLIRIEVDGQRVTVHLDQRLLWQGQTAATSTQLALWAQQADCAFKGLALTIGWDELFGQQGSVEDAGWRGDAQMWRLEAGQLWFEDQTREGMLYRGPLLEAYELLVNARLVQATGDNSGYGILPALAPRAHGPRLVLRTLSGNWQLCWQDGDEEQTFTLPAPFSAGDYQQFRLRKEGKRLAIFWENQFIGSVPVSGAATRVGLFGRRGVASFDQVRVMAI